MQSNDTFSGRQVGWLGAIRCVRGDLLPNNTTMQELDEFLEEVITTFVSPKQVLVVIGGGHNNAYPIIKSRSKQYDNSLQVFNLDAHADYRALEGRHSGNPFSYASYDGYLSRYSVFGLHKRYNNGATLSALKRDGHFFTFLEDYLDRIRLFEDDVMVAHTNSMKDDARTGIEVDMDAIENMPSSAISSSGMTFSEARFFVRQMAKNGNCVYLHLPEAAPLTEDEKNKVGKALSYLVTDFMECHPLSKF
jgi:formiminoglutamase